MGAAPVLRLSVAEYLELDRKAEVRSEYHDGEMFPMEASSVAHSRIDVRVGAALLDQLQGSRCEVLSASLRVRVSPTKYLIPDLMVVCGKLQLTDEHQDTVTNPKVIFEILSPSSEAYDQGTKFRLYSLLESFEEYVLVFQDRPRVVVYRKTSDTRWILTIYKGLEGAFALESLGITIPMSKIYDGVELTEPVD